MNTISQNKRQRLSAIFYGLIVLGLILTPFGGNYLLRRANNDSRVSVWQSNTVQATADYCATADYIFDVDMWVVGDGCYQPPHTQDSDTINMLKSGDFEVYAEVYRSGPQQSQPAEDFTLTMNGVTGPEVLDRPGDEEVRIQYTGDFTLDQGANLVIMNTAAQCPPDTTPNSVEVKKLCLHEIKPSYDLVEVPVQTCAGSAELYLYQQDPFQTIDTSFTVQRNQVLIFSRLDAILSAKVNGQSKILTTVKESTNPFGVKVQSLPTNPGDTVSISGSHQYNARGVQGYLAQNTNAPVYNADGMDVIYDDYAENQMYLQPGNYSYVFFDKYSENKPNSGPDNRSLTVNVKNGTTNLVNQTYNQPAPTPTEGAVVGNYSVSTAGNYTLSVDTEDSIYWFPVECPKPQKSSLSGCIFYDKNNNSLWDEAPTDVLSDWEVVLTGTVNDSQFTNEYGCYEFTDLPAGAYNVKETVKNGWTQTYPSSVTYDIFLGWGEYKGKLHFGNYKPYCGNDIIDSGEQCDGSDGVGPHQTCSDQCILVDLTYCGDGTKQSPNDEKTGGPNNDGYEECDGSDGVSDNQSCNNSCEIVNDPPCINCGGGGGPVNPVIDITKDAAVSFTNPGGIVDYTIKVKNNGRSEGKNLVVTDRLPNGLEYYGTTTVGIWNMDSIAVGETKTIEYQVIFADNIAAGDYVNIAKAEISNGNNDTDDATVEVRTTTVYGEEFAVLAINKDVNMSFTNPGGVLTYTVNVSNTDPSTFIAQNVIVTDRLPKGFLFNDNNSGVMSWRMGDILPGETKTISFLVNINEDVASGDYTNWVFARSDNTPEVSANVSVEVRNITTLGYELPDTNGGFKNILLLALGGLMIAAGFVSLKLRREYDTI